jgi:hypothetical protein
LKTDVPVIPAIPAQPLDIRVKKPTNVPARSICNQMTDFNWKPPSGVHQPQHQERWLYSSRFLSELLCSNRSLDCSLHFS